MSCSARLLTFGVATVLATVSAVPAAPTMILAGRGFTIETFEEGARAFGNRNYTWQEVPDALKGWRFTRMNGGEPTPLWLQCHRDMEVLLATSAAASDWPLAGWELLPDWTFRYTDRSRTKVRVYRRRLPAGPVVPLPQTGWTGGMLLIPPDVEVEVVGPLPDLKRLKYNHPGLVVDLGVGLWAWPLPMDYDDDGDVGLSEQDKVAGDLFVEAGGEQRVGARQVHQLVAVHVDVENHYRLPSLTRGGAAMPRWTRA